MARKKKGTRRARITVSLTDEMAEGLDAEIRRVLSRHPDVSPTRSSVASGLIKSGLLRRADFPGGGQEGAFRMILREADWQKERGKAAEKAGDSAQAESAFLKAAAAELDALAVLGTGDDRSVMTAVVEVLMLLKRATGYSRLPDVPSRPGLKKS